MLKQSAKIQDLNVYCPWLTGRSSGSHDCLDPPLQWKTSILSDRACGSVVCTVSASRALSGERRLVTGDWWGLEEGWEEEEKGECERLPPLFRASFPLSSCTGKELISPFLTPILPVFSPPRRRGWDIHFSQDWGLVWPLWFSIRNLWGFW